MPTDTIFVTNRNDFFHADRFDGVDYAFPPQEKVAVSVEAATHMLGFNVKDKTDTLVRLGWASKYDTVAKRTVEDPDGVKKLARFVFTRAVMVEERLDTPAAPAAVDEPEIA
jgi:hypothetical protein